MLKLNAKCEGCGCAQLVTESFCNVKRLDPSEYSYCCIADMESECLGKEEMYTRDKEVSVQKSNYPCPEITHPLTGNVTCDTYGYCPHGEICMIKKVEV